MEGGNTVVPSRHYLPSRQGWQDFHCLKLMAVVVVRVEKRNKQRRRCMVVVNESERTWQPLATLGKVLRSFG
jgi:hypothetical protein